MKYETMDGACLLASVLCEVPSLVEADLFSPDYARIALVLLDYLDQAGALRCYRVGLVVNCGIDLALWGAHRIEKLTSRLKVTDVLTENEVLAAVAAAGGVVIIAHPGAVNRNVTLLSDSQIETLIEEGLDGLEVWHRDNPPQQRERLYAIAQTHQLLVTGGSDWHGAGKPNHLGENLTDDEPWPRSCGEGRFRWSDTDHRPRL